MPIVAIDGMEVHYRESGSGPAVVLAHSSCSSSGQWKALTERLSGDYRVLAPDLIGYGKTAAWPTGRRHLHADEAAILIAMAELAGGNAQLVGHSYGGGMAVHAVLDRPDLFRSLVLIEPSLFRLLAAGGEAQAAAETRSIGTMVIDSVASGRPEQAAESFVRYFLGPAAWEAMLPERRAGIVQTIPKNALEWRHELGAGRFELEDLGRIAMPTLVLGFDQSPPGLRAICDMLERTLPKAERVQLDGLGHMAPVLNAHQVNPVIMDFLNRHR